jgi:hypothetical protein
MGGRRGGGSLTGLVFLGKASDMQPCRVAPVGLGRERLREAFGTADSCVT